MRLCAMYNRKRGLLWLDDVTFRRRRGRPLLGEVGDIGMTLFLHGELLVARFLLPCETILPSARPQSCGHFLDSCSAGGIRPGSAILGLLVITFGQRESPPAAAPLQCYYH